MRRSIVGAMRPMFTATAACPARSMWQSQHHGTTSRLVPARVRRDKRGQPSRRRTLDQHQLLEAGARGETAGAPFLHVNAGVLLACRCSSALGLEADWLGLNGACRDPVGDV